MRGKLLRVGLVTDALLPGEQITNHPARASVTGRYSQDRRQAAEFVSRGPNLPFVRKMRLVDSHLAQSQRRTVGAIFPPERNAAMGGCRGNLPHRYFFASTGGAAGTRGAVCFGLRIKQPVRACRVISNALP